MDGKERREVILSILNENKEAVTGTAIAKKLGVSRQIIVQDMALLRAQGEQIVSTSEGYLLYHVKPNTCKRVFAIRHTTEQIEDELNTIVDNGGNIINAIISHPVYGEISVDMMIHTRKNVQSFISKLKEYHFVPLMQLTHNDHYHTVEASNEHTLDEIEVELERKGYLIEE